MKDHDLWVTLEGSPGPGQGRHIVLISGDEEYRSEQSLPMLAQLLAHHHGFKTTTLFAIDPQTGLVDPRIQTNCPGLHELDNADMLIMLTRFREWPDDAMAHFNDYVFSGKPLIGLRTATHAFRYERNPTSPYAKFTFKSETYPGGFGKQILGETWVSHHGHHGVQATRAEPDKGNQDHPILQGVGSIFAPSDVYTAQPPDDAIVLAHGHVLASMQPDAPEAPQMPTMPVAWLRHPNAQRCTGRVFCSTMGAATDLLDPSLRRLIVNAVYWCLGMENQISITRSVEPVIAYQPDHFGLQQSTTGKRPLDFFA